MYAAGVDLECGVSKPGRLGVRAAGSPQLEVFENGVVRHVRIQAVIVLLDHDAAVLTVFDSRANEGRTGGPARCNVPDEDAVVAAGDIGVGDERSRVLDPDAGCDGKSSTADVGNLQIRYQTAGVTPVIESA